MTTDALGHNHLVGLNRMQVHQLVLDLLEFIATNLADDQRGALHDALRLTTAWYCGEPPVTAAELHDLYGTTVDGDDVSDSEIPRALRWLIKAALEPEPGQPGLPHLSWVATAVTFASWEQAPASSPVLFALGSLYDGDDPRMVPMAHVYLQSGEEAELLGALDAAAAVLDDVDFFNKI